MFGTEDQYWEMYMDCANALRDIILMTNDERIIERAERALKEAEEETAW